MDECLTLHGPIRHVDQVHALDKLLEVGENEILDAKKWGHNALPLWVQLSEDYPLIGRTTYDHRMPGLTKCEQQQKQRQQQRQRKWLRILVEHIRTWIIDLPA